MRDFYTKTNIKTDPIYTGKLFYALVDLAKKDYFKKGSIIVLVHTGGLQGIEGFEKRHGFSIFDKK
jgi:1-aminocyclopropane-1-carboxylate deaminase